MPSDEPYELWIYIIYGLECADANHAANELACAIEERFEDLVSKNGGAGSVELSKCVAISEGGFTLDDLRRTTEFKMEYLSHRVYPEGEIVF